MSRATNNLALTHFHVQMKAFVRETYEPKVENVKLRQFQLAFVGNEAKKAYDEIVSQNSMKQSSTKQCNSVFKKVEKQQNVKSKVVEEVMKEKVTNLNLLFKAVETGDVKFIKENFEPENVNIVDQFGWTPLMCAAYSGQKEIVNILIKLGANIKSRDKSGLSAFDLAMKNKHTEIISLLSQSKHELYRRRRSIDVNKDSISKSVNKIPVNIYCDICKGNFTVMSSSEHESSTLHIFNSKPKLWSAHYGISKCSKGYQMLLNDGWNEELGLGPEGKGNKYPVKTILKRNREGFRESNNKLARVTHFKPGDISAVKHVNHAKGNVKTMKDMKRQLVKDAAKTKALRLALQ